jgi:nucleoside-diphosphate-sugar epimerase/predicted dehydrogenase
MTALAPAPDVAPPAPAAVGDAPRVALLGAGYIAPLHALAVRRLVGPTLVGVCDLDPLKAASLGERFGCRAFTTASEMYRAVSPEVVHLLLPAQMHEDPALEAIAAGCHLVLEKPMCLNAAGCLRVIDAARQRGVGLTVHHNFLYAVPYERLRAVVRRGDLGPLDRVVFRWERPLGMIGPGAPDLWMLRSPENIILEIGVHLVSMLLDLVGMPDDLEVRADEPIDLGLGRRFLRRWSVRGRVGRTIVEIHWNFGGGHPRFGAEARGLLGHAYADLENDIFTLDRATPRSMDFDRYARLVAIGRSMRSQARRGIRDYILEKAKLSRRGSAYQNSIDAAVASCHRGLREPVALDSRVSPEFGLEVVQLADRIASLGAAQAGPPLVRAPTASPPRPMRVAATSLVLGGNGYIGRELASRLAARGTPVRAVGRSVGGGASGGVEWVRGDVANERDLERLLEGVDTVYHLARATDAKTWADYLARDVEPTRRLGELCARHGVKRLVYTGTIDSVDLGRRAGRVSNDALLDPMLHRRNLYARAKGEGERLLLQQCRESGLPVVVARPAIVIGGGGNPCHWGVGMWWGFGLVRFWGSGEHPLPLVLVEDVADALIAAGTLEGIEGRCYNLSARQTITARDYVAEMERAGGLRIDAKPVSVARWFLNDTGKWLVKMAVRHPGRLVRPSFHDWDCRSQRAIFECSAARTDLGWSPEDRTEELLRRGVAEPLQRLLA